MPSLPETPRTSRQEIVETSSAAGAPHESHTRLFLRFLRFGCLAWGGPVAQIAMIRQELVQEERWITSAQFNRTLAVYQVLPGPEAHELCVHFGMLARGRPGGVLAGLGFMLPGFLLMFLLSWVYTTYGLTPAIFAGFQVAVVALIVRAVHRIGAHVLRDWWLAAIAAVALGAQIAGVHFGFTLGAAGLAHVLAKRGQRVLALTCLTLLVLSGILIDGTSLDRVANVQSLTPVGPSALALFASGLRAGLLTFGGAYTAIPFLQHDAVEVGQWMTPGQFLDGIALGGILPAPLIIFSTFVGYLGGGAAGALAMTLGVFLPAFAMTLVGFHYLERVIANRAIHTLLDGVAAGVVGLIAVAAIDLFRAGITSLPALLIFGLALLLAYRWKAKASVVGIVLGAGVLGWMFS